MIIAISDDAMGQFLELFQIIDHQTTEESRSIFQSRFIDNHRCRFSLDLFHDALNAALAAP